MLSALLCALAPVAGSADVELRWMPGDSTLEQQLGSYLSDSQVVTDLVTLLDDNFDLVEPLSVIIGSRSDALGRPSYSAADNSIRLPYAYIEQTIRAQSELLSTVPGEVRPERDAEVTVRHAMNMVEYTLYHLVGHALIDDHTAEADDRAEAISTWLMITAWPNGASQWVEDVQAFSAASRQLDGLLDDYWHAHSLYRLRETALLCWALGADGDAVEPLLPAAADPFERRAQCTRSWSRLDTQMRRLLDPLLKPDAPLRGALQD